MTKRKLCRPAAATAGRPTKMRIVGGTLRGRTIVYHGDPCTRPMKDRVREAVFNLVGPSIKGSLAIDLFSGTGAMALEAISRGAVTAIAVDRHFPSVRGIEENACALGVADQIEVVAADAFKWSGRQTFAPSPAVVLFCCPPYELFVKRVADMLQLVEELLARLPPGSQLVLESDSRFDTQQLPQRERWDIRTYPPAVIAIVRLCRGGVTP